MAPIIAKIREAQHGFMFLEDIPYLIQHNRLAPVLVRCGGGRFTCPAQDVAHFINIVKLEGSDYVRDIGLVAGYHYA